ncbi:hypothetical protein K449DRAFT_111002 [Hypoxylon sp. EC38]|nr:hypothetical protein K449DRAFT_111002 [Hypoxylon sp. EC38]
MECTLPVSHDRRRLQIVIFKLSLLGFRLNSHISPKVCFFCSESFISSNTMQHCECSSSIICTLLSSYILLFTLMHRSY